MTEQAKGTVAEREVSTNRGTHMIRGAPVEGEREIAAPVNDHLPDGALSLDEGALASIYTSYYPRIYNYAFLQLGDIQAAEDLASEVMLKVLGSIHRYRPKGPPFSAWVFRIARNKLIDLHRRRKRRGEVDLREPPVDTRMGPQDLAERALDRGQIQIALKYLTESQRQVIVLKFIEGFDNLSIARILGRSEGAVKSLQHRALNSLRSIMSEEVG
jgi:RNA polymerase sigma-70 factor (ECF subfamily)